MPLGRRSLSTTRCWCQSNNSSSSSSSPYSLPHDAFSTPPSSSTTSPTSSSSSSSSLRPNRTSQLNLPSGPSRQRQKQYLTDSEAQAFADLLGEILPRSKPTLSNSTPSTRNNDASGGQGGVFDLFTTPKRDNLSQSRKNKGEEDGIGKVQEALRRKMLSSSGSYNRKPQNTIIGTTTTRGELTSEEELELDRLREEMSLLENEHQVLDWGLTKVFGFDQERKQRLFVDPSQLQVQPIELGGGRISSSKKGTITTTTKRGPASGPSSRIYPELLLHLFITLRDRHQSPHAALSIFSLARSNPYSYITGCTSPLYLEVLKTRWNGVSDEGDVESILQVLEEMQSGGVGLGFGGGGVGDQSNGNKAKELVQAIGETIRIDRERTELKVRMMEEEGKEFGGGRLDEREREVEIARRRFFGERPIKSWRKMEKIVEDTQDEMERVRREKKEEQYRLEDLRASGGGDRYDDNEGYTNSFERPSLSARRGDPTEHRSSSSFQSAPNRHRDLSPMELGTRQQHRSNSRPPYRGEEDDDTRSSSFGRREPEEWLPRDYQPRDRERESLLLPKRPSFANPYKIRRQGKTKEEKSARDVKHPMLFWKK